MQRIPWGTGYQTFLLREEKRYWMRKGQIFSFFISEPGAYTSCSSSKLSSQYSSAFWPSQLSKWAYRAESWNPCLLLSTHTPPCPSFYAKNRGSFFPNGSNGKNINTSKNIKLKKLCKFNNLHLSYK